MSDNRFTYQHMTDLALKALLSEHGQDDDDFKALVEDIPEPDIDIPPGLVPPLHAEEDESVLPTSSHSSYPYGNPYTLSLLPLRPSARSSKKGLKGNPHTRHLHTWTDLALEDLLPWEGEEPDLNYFAGLEAEAAAAAHAAATAAAAAHNEAAEAEYAQQEEAEDADVNAPADGAGDASAAGGAGVAASVGGNNAGNEQAGTEGEGENSETGSEGSGASD